MKQLFFDLDAATPATRFRQSDVRYDKICVFVSGNIPIYDEDCVGFGGPTSTDRWSASIEIGLIPSTTHSSHLASILSTLRDHFTEEQVRKTIRVPGDISNLDVRVELLELNLPVLEVIQ